MEIKRLEAESKGMKQQLQDSMNAKCEAFRKFEKIQYKVTETEFKEKRFQHERMLTQNKIETLSNDLNRNIQDLQQCRKESTMRIMLLEGKIHEKSTELQMSITSEIKLRESNDMLTTKVEELSKAILKINEEFSASMIKHQQDLSKMRQNDIQHQSDIEELTKTIEDLNNELQNAKKENLKIIVDMLSPSDVGCSKLSQSISLNTEHDKLKETFTAVVHEMEEKAPQIQKTKHELINLRDAYQTLTTEYQVLRDERIDAQGNIEMLLVRNSSKKYFELQIENNALSVQLCQVLQMIEGKTVKNNCVAENYESFNNVEELQDGNVKLVGLVRELTNVIHQIDNSNVDDRVKTVQDEQMEISINENKEIYDLTKRLKVSEHNLAIFKTKYEEMLNSKNSSIDKLINQLDQTKSQLSDTSGTNIKLLAEVEHKKAQLKIQQKNFDMAKRKLQSLEDKMKSSSITIAKLENSLTHLNDELQSCSAKLSISEKSALSLTKENKNLIKLEAQLRAENEMHKEQQKVQAKMMNSLDFIKETLQRQKNDNSSAEIDEKLEEMSKNCKELEKRLENEQKNFKDFEAQANATIEKLKNKVHTKGNDYKYKNLELKEQIKNLEFKNSKLRKGLKNEKITKFRLENARSVIKKLKEENEELKQQKDEIERKLNDSIEKDSQDFISCVGSSTDLEAFASSSGLSSKDEQTESSDSKSTKVVSQKRQRDNENVDVENEIIFDENAAEKRLKIKQIEKCDKNSEQDLSEETHTVKMAVQINQHQNQTEEETSENEYSFQTRS